MFVAPTESVDGRGPIFAFFLYPYASYRSLVVGRVEFEENRPSILGLVL